MGTPPVLSFDELLIQPVKDYGDRAEVVDDEAADFWSIFGRLGNFYIAIGDYHCREAAELLVELLNNKNPGLPPKTI